MSPIILTSILLNIVFIDISFAFAVVPKLPGRRDGGDAGGGWLDIPVIPVSPIPGLSGLKIDPLSLKNTIDFSKGWGLSNVTAEVHNATSFHYYNSKNNYEEQVLTPSDPQTFANSNWNKDEKTIIVIHGYTEDSTDSPLSVTKAIIRAYIEAGRQENLIFVDWRDLARQTNYFRSANNTEKVGLYVAELLIFLRNPTDNYVKNLSDVHVVGFSLGAHVAGIGSYYAAQFLNEQVGRVTGLDPAGPGFSDPSVSLESRLDPGDGAFVDVIHTNMGTSVRSFGTAIQSGHVDFYPNGGENQPGCSFAVVGEVMGACSHIKAPDYYSKTILGKVYLGHPCADYETYKRGTCSGDLGVKMGEFTDFNARGKFYLTIPEDE